LPETRKKRRIISNDDGWITSFHKPPVTVDSMRTEMLETYRGSPVDAICWCIGDHEVYNYETDVGERLGDSSQVYKRECDEWAHTNLVDLIAECGGPMTAMVQVCKEYDMDLFPSIRMNSHYHVEEDDANFGRHRRDNPHLRIGPPDEDIPIPSVEDGIRTGIDYKFYENRRHMASIICELFERWDVSGMELDFMRHPAMFRPAEAYAHRYLMTDLLRSVRRRMDEVGQERGKRLELITRVAPTLADSARTGLDVETWVKEGLVDIIEVGVGFIPFEMKIAEFVELAEGTDCQVYGSIEALRWAVDEEILAAIAQRYYRAGADGIHLFNFFNTSNEWKRRVLGGIADREKVKRLNKQYELDRSDRVESTTWHVAAFRYTIPRTQLPAYLRTTGAGDGLKLRIEIADDLDQARSEDAIDGCILGLGFASLPDGEQLEARLNDSPLDWAAARVSSDGWNHLEFSIGAGEYLNNATTVNTPGTSVEFDVDPTALREGDNIVEIRRPTEGPEPLKLINLVVKIAYRGN
jgi:hypothetical protein